MNKILRYSFMALLAMMGNMKCTSGCANCSHWRHDMHVPQTELLPLDGSSNIDDCPSVLCFPVQQRYWANANAIGILPHPSGPVRSRA